MKIVVYAGDGGSGGLKGYIKGFLSAAHVIPDSSLFVICTEEYSKYIEHVKASNVTIIVDNSSKTRLKNLILGNKLSASVIKTIEDIQPDIVYFMNSVIHKGCEQYKRVVGMHNQLYVDDAQLRRQKLSKTSISLYVQRYFARKSMRIADAVVFDSNRSMQQVKNIGINYKHGIVAYFGVETVERLNRREKFQLSSPVNLLYISTIFPYKNQLDLVHAMEILVKRNYKVKLDLLGSGPKEYTDLLIEEIRKCSLENNIVLHSWVEHSRVREFIDESDIFVYASSIETSGFGLMEGMVRGAVIACNKESCMPEILGNGGLLMDIHSATETADTIQRLIDDKNLRMSLSKNAISVSQKYTWENHAGVINKEFEKILLSN